jgi:hypothetical protein
MVYEARKPKRPEDVLRELEPLIRQGRVSMRLGNGVVEIDLVVTEDRRA